MSRADYKSRRITGMMGLAGGSPSIRSLKPEACAGLK